MRSQRRQFVEQLKKYHFELKHLLTVFIILVFFQLLTSLVHKLSLRNFIVESQEWYQQDFSDRLANLSATSLELLMETTARSSAIPEQDAKKIIQAFNIILSQQLLQQHVQDVCLLLQDGDQIVAIDNGQTLYSWLVLGDKNVSSQDARYAGAIATFRDISNSLEALEQTQSLVENRQTFHVFVPFVPKGEYVGAFYMKSTPDFGFLTREIISSYNETTLIFTALILFGFLAMFYISSYTVRERDETQELLFEERERQIKKDLDYQKEALFTKRIYHTHHKAEKVMGFIKEDLRQLSAENIEEVKYRVTRYANFISRVIYDMKWYDPPVQTIRSPVFQTDLNSVIRFMVDHLFLRLPSGSEQFRFVLELDEHIPRVPINEFVVWEILEPLIQNCLDHGGEQQVTVIVETHYVPEHRRTYVIIRDTGAGIDADLLEQDRRGVQLLFHENVTTKHTVENAGYGCYIAYELATQRCGWRLEAGNRPEGGAFFKLIIPAER